MRQIHAYKIDLAKIDGNGDFSCPDCGAKISPDDETEEVYSILEIKTKTNGLEELVILCKNCLNHIHLTGFSFLQKLAELTKEKLEGQQEDETPWYIAHT